MSEVRYFDAPRRDRDKGFVMSSLAVQGGCKFEGVAEYPGKDATHGMTGERSYCGWIWPAIAVSTRKGKPSEVTCKVCRRAMVARGLLSNTRIPSKRRAE